MTVEPPSEMSGKLRLRTYLSAAEAESADMDGTQAAVIDVIRATSTIVEALAAGARAIYPTTSAEEAIRLANSLGREDTLLCGERKGLKIPGFDLGNSPGEFTPETAGGHRLVMTTTNGTRAFAAAKDADRVVAASLLNLSGVVEALRGASDVTIVCAGKEGRYALDDALCAGLLIRALVETGEDSRRVRAGAAELDDASRSVLALTEGFRPDVDFLRGTAAGQALVAVGLEDDLALCAALDRHGLVPEMRDRMIRLPEGSA